MAGARIGVALSALFLLTAVYGEGVPTGTEPAASVAISECPQLFLDDYLVESMENLTRELVTPVKHPDNPLIVRELPWERRLIEIYGTVLYEPQSGRFRCWYLGNEYKDGIPDNPEHPHTVEYFTCYAESEDGIHWNKPLVGKKPFGVHEKHNIVIEGTHGFCVLPAPDDPDPEKRYKGAGGAVFGFSPDGIEWDIRDWRPAVGKNDTSSCVVRWNGEYLGYVRAQVADPKWPGVMRGIGLTISKDFEDWTPKQTILTTDEQDGYPWAQPYGMSVTPYGDILIGILWVLHLDHAEGNNRLGYMDTQLVVSRDGRAWSRAAERATFLGSTPGSWDKGGVFTGTTLFNKNNEIYIYYTGGEKRHGEGSGSMGIGLATLPADRFVAVRQLDRSKPGIMETRPLALAGSDLIVNADAGNGTLRVEALDKDGSVMAAFGRDDCRLTPCDRLRSRVTWGTKGIAEASRGGAVRLRFVLEGAALYAFQVRQN